MSIGRSELETLHEGAFGWSLKPRAWLRSSGDRMDKGPRTLNDESSGKWEPVKEAEE